MPDIYMIRKHVFPWSTSGEIEWTEDSACKSQPWSLFEIASSDDKIAEGIVEEGEDPANAITLLNSDNFKRAQEICNTCPVWHKCYTSADVSDFETTVRAGIIPTKFNPTLKGHPREGGDRKKLRNGRIAPIAGDPCKHCGTPKEASGSDGRIICRPCKSSAESERKRRKRAENPKHGPKAVLYARGKTCKNGHDSWLPRVKGQLNGQHYCYPCKLETDARLRERKRRERQGATMSA